MESAKTTKPPKKVATKKRVAKKIVKKKRVKKEPAKKNPEMVSYSIKMVIPTGDYANIQPEIIVKGGTLEEAHAYIAHHMNKLWKEYYLISQRKVTPEAKKVYQSAPAPTPAPQTTSASAQQPAPTLEPQTTPTSVEGKFVREALGNSFSTTPTPETSPVSSVALTKATQAIQSCMSMDALKLIVEQIKVSVKLTEDDKINLTPLLLDKEIELNGEQK